MASTDVKPTDCLFAPGRESAEAVLASALGKIELREKDWLALCRSDPAVLLAWLWQDKEGSWLPVLSQPGQLFHGTRWPQAKAREVSQRYALRILERWAAWRPQWCPDWSRPGLAQCRQAIDLAGMLARQVAARLRLNPDYAELASRSLGIAWMLSASGKWRRKPLSGCLAWLAMHWPLPNWLRKIWRCLDAPMISAVPANSEEKLLRWAQCIWQLARTRFGLPPQWTGPPLGELLAALNLDLASLPTPSGSELRPLTPLSLDWFWTKIEKLAMQCTVLGQQVQLVERENRNWRKRTTQLAQHLHELVQQRKLHSLAVLAAGAGHELGNPLAVISGYAEQLLQGEKQPDRIQALQRILAQTRRIHAVVLDLMFFARPPHPKKRRLRLDRLLRRVVRQFACEAEHKQLSLTCICCKQPIGVVADGSLIRTAIGCLLRNAIEAAPMGGQVRCLATQSDSGQAQIIVEDNGPGPDPAWQEHLFDPFFSGRSAGRGRGFGLCKVWRIAELHDGRLTWQRTPQATTQFILQLPTV